MIPRIKMAKEKPKRSVRLRMKSFMMIFWFRIFAVYDVLFSEKFELTTYNKSGRQTAKTQFCKSEINNMSKSD